MRYVILGIMFTVLLISGCASVRSVKYENITRLEKAKDYPIEIIEIRDIKKEYKVIGLAQVNAGKLHDTADVMNKLREQARKMGGDALTELGQQPIGGGYTPAAYGKYSSAGYYSGHVRDLWSAKIIVWEGEE